jgi:hypothetical protein
MVNATTVRLGVTNQDVEVVLGGGLFDSGNAAFRDRVEAGVRTVAPRAQFRRLEAAPVLGAALLGLDALGSPGEAAARLRASAPATDLPDST